METEPLIRDSYQWFEDVLSLPIDEAGMLLFSELGYIDAEKSVLVEECSGSVFVYSLLPLGRLLNDMDRRYLESVRTAAHLFTFKSGDYPHDSDDVFVFAVDMHDVGCARTDEAYGIHYMCSKFTATRSIVMFRHAGAILLSFLLPLGDGKLAIYLSDWIDANSPDTGQFEQMHVVSTSLESATDCFDGFMFGAIRDYYKYPITFGIAWSSVLESASLGWNVANPTYYSREEVNDAVALTMLEDVSQYGDDYIEDKIKELDSGESLFNLEDIEWELENTEPDEYEHLPADHEASVETINIDKIPKRILDNPVLLLEWMDANKA